MGKFKFLTVFFIILILAGIWLIRCSSYYNNALLSGEYIIDKGSSYNKIYDIVFDGKDTPIGFRFYLKRIKGLSEKLHYGFYAADNITVSSLMESISQGKQTLIKVTFPEGYNMYDIAFALENSEIASKNEMLKVFHDRSVVYDLTGSNYASLEGFLAPGTYFFSKNYPPEKIAAKMVSEFFRTLPKDFELKARSQGLSFYDALILASIVQKETYSEEESPLVAAVFLNRLRKGMLIQADPTIIYGMYSEYDGNIRKKDLLNSGNRYNTYAHRGLTPTPISNPSAIALNAVIEPADTQYLYFVAKKDGKHVFSETYQEHQKNVRIHQLGQQN